MTSEGSIYRKIYFIKSGIVDIYHEPTNSLYRELKEGDCFGEVGFFLGRERTASALCMKFTEFMTLGWH